MTLLSASPALPVRNVLAAITFYESRPGFRARHTEDQFAIVVRDGVEIYLWEANDPHTRGAEPHLAGSASCRIRVTGLRELYAELTGTGVFHPNGTLAHQPWGDDDLTTLDLDGNAIAFCEKRAD